MSVRTALLLLALTGLVAVALLWADASHQPPGFHASLIQTTPY